ncbi:hypothetical protein IQ289_31345 [Burkholderia sp. R-70006]|uniref:hypothetical protein n=1 Tax=Paraburkholderia domus TaxID=2793075 RepID=UPI0019145816|nr:hypothetical protein [Paraburkholderia domus]MBK5052880.1 hypothetical protein [Burkholderia sp. R-70006]
MVPRSMKNDVGPQTSRRLLRILQRMDKTATNKYLFLVHESDNPLAPQLLIRPTRIGRGDSAILNAVKAMQEMTGLT